MAAVHIGPWGLIFQTKLSGRCRQTTTISQYPATDGSSRSQYSAVCIPSIDGLMPPDLLTNGSDYTNFSTLGNSCAAQRSNCGHSRRMPSRRSAATTKASYVPQRNRLGKRVSMLAAYATLTQADAPLDLVHEPLASYTEMYAIDVPTAEICDVEIFVRRTSKRNVGGTGENGSCSIVGKQRYLSIGCNSVHIVGGIATDIQIPAHIKS